MFAHKKQAERWVSLHVYSILLATHIVFSGGWPGVAVTKLFRAVAAALVLSEATIRSYLSTAIQMQGVASATGLRPPGLAQRKDWI